MSTSQLIYAIRSHCDTLSNLDPCDREQILRHEAYIRGMIGALAIVSPDRHLLSKALSELGETLSRMDRRQAGVVPMEANP
jgi:hypothetical protein